jgi:hypothetical protein
MPNLLNIVSYAHKNVSSFVPYVYSLGLFIISTIFDGFVVSYSHYTSLSSLVASWILFSSIAFNVSSGISLSSATSFASISS